MTPAPDDSSAADAGIEERVARLEGMLGRVIELLEPPPVASPLPEEHPAPIVVPLTEALDNATEVDSLLVDDDFAIEAPLGDDFPIAWADHPSSGMGPGMGSPNGHSILADEAALSRRYEREFLSKLRFYGVNQNARPDRFEPL